MHKALIAFAILTAPLFASPPAAADTIYPWCRHDSRGGVNCGFTSERQCLRAKTGNTDMCMLNGLYFRGPVRVWDIPPYLPPKRYRPDRW
jgi:hypothetical protein